MKLVQKLKIWKELKRLESRVREAPSPATFVDLGQVYINLGMHERTLQLAESGLALFPQSDELRKLRKFAKKTQLNNRIKELHERLGSAAHPKLYRELAGLYLELGDFESVREVCEECIRRFPEDAGAYLILGKGRLTNFYRDLSAQDGVEAARCLQQVIALDNDNVNAHKLYTEFLFRIGSMSAALHQIEILRALCGEEPELEEMYRVAVSGPDGDQDLEELLGRIEVEGSLPHGPIHRPKQSVGVATEESIGSIRNSLAGIAEFPGVRKAAYIRGAKALVKGEIRDGRDAFLRVVRVVAKAAQRTARRIDLGNFSKGVIDGAFGHIAICSYGEVVAAAQCDRGADASRVLAELQELVASSLYLTGAGAE